MLPNVSLAYNLAYNAENTETPDLELRRFGSFVGIGCLEYIYSVWEVSCLFASV